MKRLSLSALFIFFAALAFAQADLQIKTANGILQGTRDSVGVRSYKGIPFAQPPVGDLRWKEPQPPKNWSGVRMADHFGNQAMQKRIYSDMMFRSAGTSEDCLYLNVWTPAKSAGEHLPVLVYFYGGGFMAGDGSEYRYDGESLAVKGIVTVTVNYRLGIFGFMAHPELTKESPHNASGNYGVMDQHAALEWVKKNIAAFGGDPNQVTIGGESAGGTSVAAQVTSPLSKGLFVRAIAESGSDLGGAPMPLIIAESNGTAFMKKIGAASLADMRKIPADSLLNWAAGSHFGLIVDGYFIPELPQTIFTAGKQMHVALLAGWNSGEGDYHSIIGKDTPSIATYRNKLQQIPGINADTVMHFWPAATDADVKLAANNLATDRSTFSTWKFAYLQNKTGGQPVYRYLFTQKRPAYANGNPNVQMGAYHASELEYALGNLRTNKVYAWTADDWKVSDTMEDYFANFIKTGNPNGGGLPQWGSLQSGQFMVIGVDSHSEQANEARFLYLNQFFDQSRPARH